MLSWEKSFVATAALISDKVQDIGRPERRSFNIEEENIRSRTGIPTSIAFADTFQLLLVSKIKMLADVL